MPSYFIYIFFFKKWWTHIHLPFYRLQICIYSLFSSSIYLLMTFLIVHVYIATQTQLPFAPVLSLSYSSSVFPSLSYFLNFILPFYQLFLISLMSLYLSSGFLCIPTPSFTVSPFSEVSWCSRYVAGQ